jgi:type II secretory pathway pseudopilin PulG
MSTALGILILVVSLVGVIAVGIAFVWAARKDGEEDEATQRRLGIRRRTRLGR